MKQAHKIGAVFYILWGLLHIVGAGGMLYTLNTEGGVAALAMLGSALPQAVFPEQVDPVTSALYAFHSWNLLWMGALSLVVAIKLNWRNSRVGYWVNLVIVSAADLGLIATLIVPGYMAVTDGLAGPLLWIGALLFSTIGLLRQPTPDARQATAAVAY